MTADCAERIAVLNDRFRARLGLPDLGESAAPGSFVMTAGIAALAPELQIEAWAAVRNFAQFSEDNDPHGERDFGAVEFLMAGPTIPPRTNKLACQATFLNHGVAK